MLKSKNYIFWKWANGTKYEKSKNTKNNVVKQNNMLFHVENKREEIGSKLSERTMIAQIGLNPFLQNSYENDIANYDNYIKK
jgi:hypothetical protein